MSKITKSEESKIIELYLSGKSSAEVSELVNHSSSSVLRVLKRNGIKIRSKSHSNHPNKFSEEIALEMVRLYTEERKDTNYIAKLYNTYNTSVRRILLRHNITLRNQSEAQRVINLEDVQKHEGTSDFDYFLGLLATDGCVTGNNIVLDFSEENKELLDYWNEFLGNKCNINCSIHKVFKVPQYRIAFKNPEVVEYLATYGIVPNKTFDLELRYINWDVLRGIIDGDGCVSERNGGATLAIGITSGCRKFLEQIEEFLINEGIESHLRESHRNKNITYDLYVYKSSDIVNMYNKLYTNAHYFLKRKENKFGRLLKKFNMQHVVNLGKEEHF